MFSKGQKLREGQSRTEARVRFSPTPCFASGIGTQLSQFFHSPPLRPRRLSTPAPQLLHLPSISQFATPCDDGQPMVLYYVKITLVIFWIAAVIGVMLKAFAEEVRPKYPETDPSVERELLGERFRNR